MFHAVSSQCFPYVIIYFILFFRRVGPLHGGIEYSLVRE